MHTTRRGQESGDESMHSVIGLHLKKQQENKDGVKQGGSLFETLFLFLLGGFLYFYMEILFRGYSHVSMIVCGGLAFVCVGMLNEKWDMSVLSQMVIGSIIITTLEFITGWIVNVVLHLGVWDYTMEPYNIAGQICLAYSNLWFLLAFLCIVLDDFVRCHLFGEPKKKYRWL